MTTPEDSSREAGCAGGPNLANRIDNEDTFKYRDEMIKDRTPVAGSALQGAVAVAERTSLVENKRSINLRIELRTRQLIDEAASLLGKTRTEFMIDSARLHAMDVLLDQRLFMLGAERHDAFVHALDNPPAPGPRLRALLRRAPAWKT